MRYEGALLRPPSESQSFLLQITVGCSYNRCSYCGFYRDKEFRIKPIEDVLSDIEEGTHFRFRRVFLCDGDAMIAPADYLIRVLETIRKSMPYVERVGCFADARSVLAKTPEQLARMQKLGLQMIYLGLESGDDDVLKRMERGITVEQTIQAGQRIKNAGMLLSAIVMLGLGGVKGSKTHALKTAKALNSMEPEFIGVLTTMLVEDTPLFESAQAGQFDLPSRLGLLEELQTILKNLSLRKGLLTTNHSSNYLPMRVVLPYQREEAIDHIQHILDTKDESILKPDFLRDL